MSSCSKIGNKATATFLPIVTHLYEVEDDSEAFETLITSPARLFPV